jgi:peptide/nickel transport system ATP-binding protein
MADDIAVMYAGRIVEKAATAIVFDGPEHPYTWGLLKSIPRLDTPRNEELVPISGRPPSLIRRPGGCFFHPRCPYARESHTRIDPKREPVPGDPGHEVACLLEPDLRARLWKRLVAGESPDVLKREVAAASATPLVATEPASGTPGVEP